MPHRIRLFSTAALLAALALPAAAQAQTSGVAKGIADGGVPGSCELDLSTAKTGTIENAKPQIGELAWPGGEPKVKADGFEPAQQGVIKLSKQDKIAALKETSKHEDVEASKQAIKTPNDGPLKRTPSEKDIAALWTAGASDAVCGDEMAPGTSPDPIEDGLARLEELMRQYSETLGELTEAIDALNRNRETMTRHLAGG